MTRVTKGGGVGAVAVVLLFLQTISWTYGNTITVTRGLFSLEEETTTTMTNACNYTGVIHVAHPMSLRTTDKFFSTGQLQMTAMEILVDYLNADEVCGVQVQDENYAVVLQTLGDESSNEKVEEISVMTENVTEFFVGPYSSGLTGVQAPIVQENGHLLVAGE